MKNNELIIQVISFEKGIEFQIGKEKKILSWKSIFQIKDTLKQHTQWYENWYPYIKYYENYSKEKISEYLKNAKNEDGNYQIGDNYAIFLPEKLKPKSDNMPKMCDNNNAAKILSKEYKKEVGINRLKKLSFDPEMSHCWISTKDLKEAENFLWWIYLKYIKPTLNTVLKSYI
jgi:hypothetical protein